MLPNRDSNSGKYIHAPEELDPTPISAKVPVGIKDEIRKLASRDLSTWVREAIAEKLEREKSQQVAS